MGTIADGRARKGTGHDGAASGTPEEEVQVGFPCLWGSHVYYKSSSIETCTLYNCTYVQ